MSPKAKNTIDKVMLILSNIVNETKLFKVTNQFVRLPINGV